jgi:hypothetical protein
MASWSEFASAESEFAELARRFLDLNTHKVLATLRRDGSPRLSGTELQFCLGQVFFGSMPGAQKAKDIGRDPRISVHSGSVDPGPNRDGWDGDTTFSGTAVEVLDPSEIGKWSAEQDFPGLESGDFHLFRAELSRVTVVKLNPEREALAVSWWTPQEGLRTASR